MKRSLIYKNQGRAEWGEQKWKSGRKSSAYSVTFQGLKEKIGTF